MKFFELTVWMKRRTVCLKRADVVFVNHCTCTGKTVSFSSAWVNPPTCLLDNDTSPYWLLWANTGPANVTYPLTCLFVWLKNKRRIVCRSDLSSPSLSLSYRTTRWPCISSSTGGTSVWPTLGSPWTWPWITGSRTSSGSPTPTSWTTRSLSSTESPWKTAWSACTQMEPSCTASGGF